MEQTITGLNSTEITVDAARITEGYEYVGLGVEMHIHIAGRLPKNDSYVLLTPENATLLAKQLLSTAQRATRNRHASK